MTLPYSYKKVHATLRRLHGPAKDHTCRCGQPAVEWAYQFTGEELRAANGERPHSADPDDYAPMCRKCHNKLDMEHDPVMAERKRNSGGYREELAEKWRTDTGYVEKMQGVLTENSRAVAERLRTDPEFAAQRRERTRRTIALKMESDPEYAERAQERAREMTRARVERMKADPQFGRQTRRRCAECDYTSTSGAVTRHQKSTGHTDWVPVNDV